MFRTPESAKNYQSPMSPRTKALWHPPGSAGTPPFPECSEPPDAVRKIVFRDDTPAAREGPVTPATRPAPVKAPRSLMKTEARHRSRIAEARACLNKAKHNLGSSRNLKAEIKAAVLEAVNRLYELIKESEQDRAPAAPVPAPIAVPEPAPTADRSLGPVSVEVLAGQTELLKSLKEHISELRDNSEKLDRLRDSLASGESVGERTYASVAAVSKRHTGAQAPERTTLHSVVVSSTQEMDTGAEILERVRKAVDAKEGWVRVERVRKAKDQRVIMGCESKEERRKLKARLEAAGENLVVEEVKNRNPLLILRDVLLIHSDEDVLRALKNQNRELFDGLGDEEQKVLIKFRKKTRNPHVNSIVLSVSPAIWRRALEGGKLRIDLQRVRVEDQTPLVQCTRCLAYGHGKRLCTEPADLCSHCGGPHLRLDCPVSGEAAVCVNCTRAKLGEHSHNAFSKECPVHKKWDAFARATIAYC